MPPSLLRSALLAAALLATVAPLRQLTGQQLPGQQVPVEHTAVLVQAGEARVEVRFSSGFRPPRPEIRELPPGHEFVPLSDNWQNEIFYQMRVERDVLLAGEPLAAGRYGIFISRGEETWTLLLVPLPALAGEPRYDPATGGWRQAYVPAGAVRITVPTRRLERPEEGLFGMSNRSGTAIIWKRWGEEARLPLAAAAARTPTAEPPDPGDGRRR